MTKEEVCINKNAAYVITCKSINQKGNNQEQSLRNDSVQTDFKASTLNHSNETTCLKYPGIFFSILLFVLL